MSGYRVISSDDHVVEPPDLWTSRIEPKFRDRSPRLVRESNGDWWYCEDKKLSSVHVGSQTGMRFEHPEALTRGDVIEKVRPGGYIPEEHVKDMATDGVDVSFVYPSCGLLLYRIPDTELLTALFKTYNDWLAEFCSPFPKQLKGIAMINLDNVQEGVEELERSSKVGLAGAMISVYPPEDRPYSSPEYYPFWAAAQDMGIPISLHAATNRPGPGTEFRSFREMPPSFICNSDHWVRMSLGNMIFSGVFERYPGLQVGAVEHELSWAPHFLDRLDYTYTQRAPTEVWYRYNRRTCCPATIFTATCSSGSKKMPWASRAGTSWA